MNKEKLFEAFAPVSTAEWKDRISKDLKGADYNKKLVWKTDEGFDVQPFYRADDTDKLPHMNCFPGSFPFVRGNEIKQNNWLIRQDINVIDIKDANKKAILIKHKGVDSLGFIFKDSYKPTVDDIITLCDKINVGLVELNFKSAYPLELVEAVKRLSDNGTTLRITGSVEFDPIGDFSLNGKFHSSEKKDMEILTKLHAATTGLPNFQYLSINATTFHNSGSGIVNELAFAMAMGAEYLTYLTNNGAQIDDAAPKIRFHFSVGSNYFMEIAKFRAAKFLWSKIVVAYGLNNKSNARMYIHCSNSQWNKTIYDPYVNMLRTTTEAMSAIIGGVNSLSVTPFNYAYETETEFSERIARNQQLVLKGESYLDKIADIGAGSYYIENLTDKLIKNAWKQFLKIDEEGGYISAFKNNTIQNIIADEAAKKDSDIVTRRKSILGVNQYPNSGEQLSSDFNFPKIQETNSEIKPLVPYRGARQLEELRFKTDTYSAVNKRPIVWMFTYGNLSMRKARSQFATNFFGCAGFKIIDNPGFNTIDEGIQAAKNTNPDIVVICSSDKEYADIVEPIYNALRYNTIVVLAGYPKELITRLNEIGLTNLIHVKSNLLVELKKYQKLVTKK